MDRSYSALFAALVFAVCIAACLACPVCAYATTNADNWFEQDQSGVSSPLASIPLIAQESDDIASGTSGTCKWVIDASGKLIVSPKTGDTGTLASWYTGSSVPWKSYASKITAVEFVGEIKASTCDSMFSGCSSLTSVSLSGLNTSGVSVMRSMFQGCSSLTDLNVSGLNGESVTAAQSMFEGCAGLKTLDLSAISFASMKYSDSLLANCTALEEVGLPAIAALSGTAFSGCSALKSVSGSTVKLAAKSEGLFADCHQLESVQGIKNWDATALEDADKMFMGCTALSSLDLSGWDVSSTNSFNQMFSGCSSLKTLDLSNWDFSALADAPITGGSCESMFEGCTALTALNTSGWNMTGAKSLEGMFKGCSSLSELDVSGWDTSKVTYFKDMFSGCSSLVLTGLSGWNVSSGLWFGNMFERCSTMQRLDLSKWDVSAGTSFSRMFAGCSSLGILDVSGWHTSSASYFNSMFNGCSALRFLDLSGFDCSQGVTTDDMFNGCSSLCEIVLGERFVFRGAFLPSPPSQMPYDGKWAYQTANSQEVYTPYGLTLSYKGATMSGLYVWATLTDLSSASVSPIPQQGYTAQPIEPSLTVMLNGVRLQGSRDYSVQFSNNTNPGTAKATVTGTGRFCGSVSADFTIGPGTGKVILESSSKKVAIGEDGLLSTMSGSLPVVEWKSSNSKVIKVDNRFDDGCIFTAWSRGTATLTAVSRDGKTASCKVTVAMIKPTLTLEEIEYGQTSISGAITSKGCTSDANYKALLKTYAGSTVTATIGKKTYKTKVSSSGSFKFKKIPIVKAKTKVTVKLKKFGQTSTVSKKVGKDTRNGGWVDVGKLLNGQKTCSASVWEHLMPGDKIVLKLAGKTYKKVYNGKKSKYGASFKFKHSAASTGQKATVIVYSKFGKKLATGSAKVYRGDTIHLGDTEAEVLSTYGFDNPKRVNTTPYSVQWVYSGGKCVIFRNGRVSYWWLQKL